MAESVFISNVLPAEARSLIPREWTVDYNETDIPLSKAELIRRLQGKEALVCHIISAIDEEVFAACPDLNVVANVAVGFNNVDVAAASRHGVIVTNTPDVLTETTADFAWALLMAAARRVVEADRYARAGEWKAWKWDLLWGADIHGKTLGVIGFGRIGRAVARRAGGFNMRILYHDALRADAAAEREFNATFVAKERLLADADFVTVHTNLTVETRHLLDEAALVRALREGWIAGAGLDVFEDEPTIHPGLLPLPNVVLAPHIASASRDTRTGMAILAVRNCVAVLEGKPAITPVR